MTRIILQMLLPFLMPIGVYLLWLWYAKKRSLRTGNTPPNFTRGYMFWAIAAGLALMITSLVFTAVTSGVDPDHARSYQAPRLEDGKIVSPGFSED